MKIFSSAISLLILYVLPNSLIAQERIDTLTYSRQEVMIPMRDGIKLFTVIFAPKDVKDPLPFLLLRTPYGVSRQSFPNKTEYVFDLAKDGYIFVYQDIRGCYKSEGILKLQDLFIDKKNPNSIDESTDAYDCIDWLLKNIPNNNGRVGMYGYSASGLTTLIGTIEPHPALKAASEQASPADWFIGDDFFHNGAFRLSYALDYAFFVDNMHGTFSYPIDKYDAFEWYLKLGPLSNVNAKYFHDSLPSWNNFVMHPNYDGFWKRQSMIPRIDTPKIPMLHVAGWWDQEDFYGPLKAYEILEKNDINNQNFIVIGPWNHGGWTRGRGDKIGNISFGESTSEKFRKNIQSPFFTFYLKGQGTNHFPNAITFQTGSNIWKDYENWPPINKTIIKELYLSANGMLSFELPLASEAFDQYLSDPMHPIPYRNRPIESDYGWSTWLLEDQRFVHNRPDILSWESVVLTKDITVTGNLLADLFASTSGTDADWIVKLIDVYPEDFPENPRLGGYQLMMANDVFRARFRNSYSTPEPVKSNQVYEYKIDLHSIDHVFKAGHKIMVQVQSSWFPVIDRNPQKFIPNIFEAKETDFIITQQRVFRSTKYPSHIKLPVVQN
jgi:putative CocE/NonD family hydrolase